MVPGSRHPHLDLVHVGGVGRPDRQPEVPEHDRHPLVDGQDVGVHLGHAFGSGHGDEVFEQQRRDAPVLLVVSDDHRDLRRRPRRLATVVRHPDQLVVAECSDGHRRVAHDEVGQLVESGGAGREEAQVAVVERELGVEPEHGLAVGGVEPADEDDRSVGQQRAVP